MSLLILYFQTLGAGVAVTLTIWFVLFTLEHIIAALTGESS